MSARSDWPAPLNLVLKMGIGRKETGACGGGGGGCSQKGKVPRRTLAVQGKSKRPKAKCTMPRKQIQGR